MYRKEENKFYFYPWCTITTVLYFTWRPRYYAEGPWQRSIFVKKHGSLSQKHKRLMQKYDSHRIIKNVWVLIPFRNFIWLVFEFVFEGKQPVIKGSCQQGEQPHEGFVSWGCITWQHSWNLSASLKITTDALKTNCTWILINWYDF